MDLSSKINKIHNTKVKIYDAIKQKNSNITENVPFDLYHKYIVDIPTISAVRSVREIFVDGNQCTVSVEGIVLDILSGWIVRADGGIRIEQNNSLGRYGLVNILNNDKQYEVLKINQGSALGIELSNISSFTDTLHGFVSTNNKYQYIRIPYKLKVGDIVEVQYKDLSYGAQGIICGADDNVLHNGEHTLTAKNDSTHDLYIFGVNANDRQPHNQIPTSITKVTIYSDNFPIYNLVPFMSAGKIGLFDSISNTFFSNCGVGDDFYVYNGDNQKETYMLPTFEELLDI